MSYTDKIKSELIAAVPKSPHCRRALLFGMLAMRGYLGAEGGVHLPLEGESLFSLAETLIAEQMHREPRRAPVRGTVATEALVFSSSAAVSFLEALPVEADSERPSWEKCTACRRFFLVGMFLSSAYVSDPEREYRVEFSCKDRRPLAVRLLRRYELSPRPIDRRAERLLYFRDSTAVEDLFANLGVHEALFSIMEQKMQRSFRKEINRLANCEANNIEKTVAVSRVQSELVRRLMEEDKLGALPPELRETALLRYENPDLSLTRLAAAARPPLTKSGLNHRLKKLTEAAEALLGEQKGEPSHE